MEKIFYKDTLIAILVKKFENGVTSLTDPKEPLQLVIHKRLTGEYTKAHTHATKKRITEKLQECLVVLKGKIKIDFYSPDKKNFKSIDVSPGEVVILMNGGHSVHTLKDSEFVEVKNGPFVEDKILI